MTLPAAALSAVALSVVTLAAGCAETGRAYVEMPLLVAGTGERAFVQGDFQVELERADVAFGPLWLCATQSASPEFCESAQLELTETVTIDALDDEPRPAATAFGITGTVRSAMWDYGITWLPAQPRPRPNPGAVDGEYSARFEVRVSHADGRTFRVLADLAITPNGRGVVIVRGQRVPTHTIAPEGDALTVRADPAAWWRRVDLARLAARAAAGEDPVVLAPGDADHEALLVAMTAGSLPALEWRAP
jgi:hypothetical protein